jgi:GT2 family glycosyltransferase
MSVQVVIVILNWNGAQNTITCLKSLEALQYPAHVIVVDNASSDDSITRLRAAHPDLDLIVNTSNAGFGAGNNLGIRRALELGADFVWLLNNDTAVMPQTLTALIAAATRVDVKVGVVGSVLFDWDGYSVQGDSYRQVQTWGGGVIQFCLGTSRHRVVPVPIGSTYFLTAASILVSREALEVTGGFDEEFFMYWEDVDLCFRIRQAGFQMVVADQARVLHRGSATSARYLFQMDRWFNYSAARFFRKHARFPMIPILVGVGGRFLKRVFLGELARAQAVVAGAIMGWKS